LTPEECLIVLTRILQSGTGVLPLRSSNSGSENGNKPSLEVDLSEGSIRRRKTGDEKKKKLARTEDLKRMDDEDSDDSIGNGMGDTRSPLMPLEKLDKDDPRAIEFRERLRNW
jgi:hypothetical protein